VYVASKQVTLFGKSLNAAGPGAYVFILASVVLLVGVLKSEAESNSPEVGGAGDGGDGV
jgi:hypothetical protein